MTAMQISTQAQADYDAVAVTMQNLATQRDQAKQVSATTGANLATARQALADGTGTIEDVRAAESAVTDASADVQELQAAHVRAQENLGDLRRQLQQATAEVKRLKQEKKAAPILKEVAALSDEIEDVLAGEHLRDLLRQRLDLANKLAREYPRAKQPAELVLADLAEGVWKKWKGSSSLRFAPGIEREQLVRRFATWVVDVIRGPAHDGYGNIPAILAEFGIKKS